MDVNWKKYKRTGSAEMCAYEEGMSMRKVSISAPDKEAGSPKPGDMIARNPNNPNDQWLVSAKYFQDNFREDLPVECKAEKSLHNSDVNGARKNVSDIKVFGNGDAFQLICKASSGKEGWMKSTKAMDVGSGCWVQVTTQQRNPGGSYSVAEALTFAPGIGIYTDSKTGERSLYVQG